MLTIPISTHVSAEIDAVTVQRSIDRGVEYLRKTQTPQGGWREHGNQSCGLSALCTLAWANAGVPYTDPAFVKAMRYLRTHEPRQTYSVALQTLVFCHVGALEDLPKIRRNVAWLEDEQKGPKQRFPGSWSYGGARGNGDPSNAQFAVLALGAAAERGVEVDPKVFEAAAAYWKRIQKRSGGWSYGGPTASGSMTCAGIASLIICGGSLSDLQNDDGQQQKLYCCDSDSDDDSIARALKHLSDIFTLRANPNSELRSYFYYLYAVERVGRLSGRRLLGGRDWYREGAERLVAQQDNFQGFWRGGGVVESNPEIATSFALLFLAKGKRQVVIGRLDDSASAQGARGGAPIATQTHPDAIRQLVRFVQRDWSKDLTWQTIQAETASVQDLLQVPVLVIAGQDTLQFDQSLRDNLKAYLDQGGTILFDAQAGEGCGTAEAFQISAIELCQEWFPNSALQKLPTSHPIWFAERLADPTKIAEDYWVYGVGACCRTPVFYSPRSLTCRWEHGGPIFRGDELPATLQKDIATGITIGENLLAYATGRDLKDKLDQVDVIDAAIAPVPARGSIPVAVGAVGAGEEQVSSALPRAAAIIRDRLPIEVIAVDEPIALTKESLSRVGALVLHGQTNFELSDESREALKSYVQQEGIVIAAPVCGETAFVESMRRELELLGVNSPLRLLPADHPAFTTGYGGYDLTNVEIRRPTRQGNANKGVQVRKQTGSPVIEAITVNGVDTVFFSPLDLSCALESQNSIQCPGYATDDAAKIIAGLILYGLNQ